MKRLGFHTTAINYNQEELYYVPIFMQCTYLIPMFLIGLPQNIIIIM